MATGIFYHPSFSRRSYLTQGTRLEDFPRAIEYLLRMPEYRLIESPALEEDWILKVHTPELLAGVRRDRLCSTAWHSAGGVVLAAEMIVEGEIDNAFAFIGAGGHHSGRDFFGGYCCFNDVVIAIRKLRELHGVKRFAILDTDAHHGDGTRSLIENDTDTLHVCLCSSNYVSKDGTKVDVSAPGAYSWQDARRLEYINALYADAATKAFAEPARAFKPELIFWYFGFDTHRGDYGDIGLTLDAYLAVAKMVKAISCEICRGRLEVVLGGGSMREIARTVIPPVLEVLGGKR